MWTISSVSSAFFDDIKVSEELKLYRKKPEKNTVLQYSGEGNLILWSPVSNAESDIVSFLG